jgi:beta-glucosidase
MIYGVDAVHGHNNLFGATIFPHNIGLGAANDPQLVEQIGQATAQEMIATGIYWNFAPVVAVVRDVRWGRTYESYGENTDLVTSLSLAYIRGLQGEKLGAPGSVLATPKHYVGDGGTRWGSSTTNGYSIDQGVTDVDEATLRAVFLPPYAAAVKNGAMSVMVSFSSWGGLRMHAQHYLLTDVLKRELGFKGFIISDWAGITMIPGDAYTQVVTGINAGIDMEMVPYNYGQFITLLKQAVDKGDVSLARIDDAVRRILTVKFELGLFEHPFSDSTLAKTVGSAEHRALAREAVSKSLVLLKNDNAALPLAKDAKTVFVLGAAANSLGIQLGGWSIEWQGSLSDLTPGTTLLKAIQQVVSKDTVVTYDARGEFADVKGADGNPPIPDICIAGIGETPYAEGQGDSADLALPTAEAKAVERMRDRCKKLVVVLISGRPIIINEQMRLADAVVAAWLPGTEGEGITDVLFGDKPFMGKLPFTWPRDVKQLPFDFKNLPTTGCEAPLFPYGYGLDVTATTQYHDNCYGADATIRITCPDKNCPS